MRFDFIVLVTLFSLPTWSTSAGDDLFSPDTTPKRLLKAGKSTSAPTAAPPLSPSYETPLRHPSPSLARPSDTTTSPYGPFPASSWASHDDAPPPDDTSQTSPRSLLSRTIKRMSGGHSSASVRTSADIKRTTPRTPKGSPRAESDSSPRSVVTTEITTLSSSSSEGVSEQTSILDNAPLPPLPKGRRPRNYGLPLATPVTPKGLASATGHMSAASSPRTPPSPTHQDTALARTATPPLLLPVHEYIENEDDRAPTPPPLIRTLQPMLVGEAMEAVIDFCVYQGAFFETMRTQNSILMRRNVVQEHRLFERVMALPFAQVVDEYKKNKIDLAPLVPHIPELMSFFLYLTHNAREFEHRYITRVKSQSLPFLEATMLLITRSHIFSLQHQRRIHNTYRALYQLCTDAQRAAFEQLVRNYNESIAGEYANIASTSSSSSSSPAPSPIPTNLIYNAATFHETWRNDTLPPRGIQFLLGLSQDDQNKYFEPVKNNPSFFDVPGTSRVFPTLLLCDSPFIGILKSYHLERELRLGRVQESPLPLPRSHTTPTTFTSSSTDEPITLPVARASSSDKPLRPRRSSAGAHFADGVRPQKASEEQGEHKKHLLPHLPSIHLPSIHLPSSLGALKLSPRGTQNITPRETIAKPGNTPRKKPVDQISTKQTSRNILLSRDSELSAEESDTTRERDDTYLEIPQRHKHLTRVLSLRDTTPASHVTFSPETDSETITQSGVEERSIDFTASLRTITARSASGDIAHTPKGSSKVRGMSNHKSRSKKSTSHKSKSETRKKHSRK